jgi:hypothetical protein
LNEELFIEYRIILGKFLSLFGNIETVSSASEMFFNEKMLGINKTWQESTPTHSRTIQWNIAWS